MVLPPTETPVRNPVPVCTLDQGQTTRVDASVIQPQTIPLSKIAPPSHDVRPDRTADDIKAKLESINQQGLLTPLFGFWRPDGMFELIDGLTRYLALLMGGYKEAEIHDIGRVPEEADKLVMQVTCNIAHAEMTDLQLADAIARHQKLTAGTQAAACKALQISAARGSKIKAMFTAPQEVLDMMAAGELKPRSVYALSRLAKKLADIPVVIDLAKKARDLPMAVESVEEAVAELMGKGRKQKKLAALKAKAAGALLSIPGDWTWTKLKELAELLKNAATRGEKMEAPFSFLPSILKT